MSRKISKLAKSRKNGAHQLADQRNNILDSAEKLFLEQGLAQTSMSHIAKEAGLSRVSLYRYFPDLHPIAFAVAVRMLHQIYQSIGVEEDSNLERVRKMMLTAIDQFYELRDAYRFLGMFDQLYGAGYPTEELAVWYKERVGGSLFDAQKGVTDVADMASEQIVMIGNCVMSFLQKLAARGDLMAEEQGVSLAVQLNEFKKLIAIYFDHLFQERR